MASVVEYDITVLLVLEQAKVILWGQDLWNVQFNIYWPHWKNFKLASYDSKAGYGFRDLDWPLRPLLNWGFKVDFFFSNKSFNKPYCHNFLNMAEMPACPRDSRYVCYKSQDHICGLGLVKMSEGKECRLKHYIDREILILNNDT